MLISSSRRCVVIPAGAALWFDFNISVDSEAKLATFVFVFFENG